MSNFASMPSTALGLLVPHGDPYKEISEALRRARIERMVDTSRRRLVEQILDVFRDELSERVGQHMEVNVADLVLAGVKKHSQLVKGARRTLEVPGSEVTVPLAAFTLTSEDKSTIELMWQGTVLATLDLVLALELRISAAKCVLRDGRMVALEAGPAGVSAELRCQDVELLSAEGSFDVAVNVGLSDGIPILSRAPSSY